MVGITTQLVAIIKKSGIMANPVKRKPPARGLTNSTKKAKALESRVRGNQKEINTYNSSDEESDGFGDDEDDNEETGEETMRAELTGRIVTPRGKHVGTDLFRENDELKKKLQMVARQKKVKQLIHEEDELVIVRLRRYVKEQLWKKVKFITDNSVLDQALNRCTAYFGVEDNMKVEWKLQMSRELQQSINNWRNNCITDLGEAYMSKYNTTQMRVSGSVDDKSNAVFYL